MSGGADHGGGHDDHGHKPDLEHIVHALAPAEVRKIVRKPHEKIVDAYKLKTEGDTYQDVVKEITEFMKHYRKMHHQTEAELPDWQAFGEGKNILEAVFRDRGGFKYAVQLATEEGGIKSVIDELARGLENQSISHYTSHQFASIDPTDMESQADLVKQVFDKYKAFFPKDTEFEKPEFYAAQHQEIVGLYQRTMDSAKQFVKKGAGHGHGGGGAAHH